MPIGRSDILRIKGNKHLIPCWFRTLGIEQQDIMHAAKMAGALANIIMHSIPFPLYFVAESFRVEQTIHHYF